jgi:soluble lytic murein transglycosylase-like protein
MRIHPRRLMPALIIGAFILATVLYVNTSADQFDNRLYALDIAANYDTNGVDPPTPTPTATPTPKPTPAQITTLPQRQFPPPVERWRPLVSEIMPADMVDVWLDIIRCESFGNPNAVGSQGERGLTQIHPRYHPRLATFDPRGNIQGAYQISGGGYWLQPWTCARRLGHWPR